MYMQINISVALQASLGLDFPQDSTPIIYILRVCPPTIPGTIQLSQFWPSNTFPFSWLLYLLFTHSFNMYRPSQSRDLDYLHIRHLCKSYTSSS